MTKQNTLPYLRESVLRRTTKTWFNCHHLGLQRCLGNQREAFAHAEAELRPGQDVVVVARPPAGELAEREGLAGLDASLTELIAKAGLRAGSGAPSEREGA